MIITSRKMKKMNPKGHHHWKSLGAAIGPP
jgi:hypothetical protein